MCKVPKAFRCKEYKYSQETIQIGAVLLDENYEIVSKFSTYVKPQYGQMDSFISRLTGIGVADIIDAPNMCDALEMFSKWLPDSDVCCVSWSNSDDCQIRHKEKRSELVARAKTDPEAMEELMALRAKEAEARAKKKAKEEARMAVDPEYAKMMEERRKEYNRKHAEKRKAKLDDIKLRAENGDEAAIEELGAHRKYFREAELRNRRKLYELADAGDPVAIAKKEEYLRKRRDAANAAYRAKKAESGEVLLKAE